MSSKICTELVSRRGHRVRVRRSVRARRISLRIDRATSEAVLVMPDFVSAKHAQRFLDAQADWLDRHLARLPGPAAVAPGQQVPVRGVPRQIRHDPRAPRTVRLDADSLMLGGPEAAVPARLKRFLVAEARQDLSHSVAGFADTLGVAPSGLSVRDTRRQWGSAAGSGRLSFSWRLVMAPPWVLDYVAAHEVAHLVEMNHSARFWALVDQLVPDRAQARAWLTAHGPALHRYRFEAGA